MEKIAFISGETIYYWSSIVLTLATLTAICFFWSLYLGRGGNGIAAFSVVPLAIALSLLLGRLVHWYCRTSSYDSFEAAMKPFSPGGYALLGVFAGCVLAAVVIRLLHFDRNLPQMLDCMAVAGCAGIAVGRLACFFNSTDRGQIITSTQSLPWVYPVTNAVSGATEYRLATFILQAMAALGLFLYYSHQNLYGGVQRAMQARFSTVEGRLQATGTAGSSQATSESRSQSLRRTVEQFDEKDKFEFMLLDSSGVVLATSSGTMNKNLLSEGRDFYQAVTGSTGSGIQN